MHGKKYEQEEIDNIINDYNNGMRPKDLGIKYNRDASSIRFKLKSLGIYTNVMHEWTKEEIEFLKNSYATYDWDILLMVLNKHNKESIIHKASRLKLKRENYFWTDEDVQTLVNNYSTNTSVADIIKLLNYKHSYQSVIAKASDIGLCKNNRWKDEELDIIKNNYENLLVDEIIKMLPNRNRSSVIVCANSKLGLINLYTKSRTWKVEEDNYIIDNWETMTDEDIVKNLNRPTFSVKARRHKLGLLRLSEATCYNTLSEYIRKRNGKWKFESAKNSGFKCYLSNKKFNDIHHIYGFNLILDETLDVLDIEAKDSFDNYIQNELDIIASKFIEIQDQYPLGICLSKEIHKLFHSIYGYGNNTPEQWYHFEVDYKNGEYKDLLHKAS